MQCNQTVRYNAEHASIVTDEDLHSRNVLHFNLFSLLLDCSTVAQPYPCRINEPLPNELCQFLFPTCRGIFAQAHAVYTRPSFPPTVIIANGLGAVTQPLLPRKLSWAHQCGIS